MFFTKESKIKRVARHLKGQLEEECQKRWVEYLIAVGNNGANVIEPQHFENEHSFANNRIQTHPLRRSKEHFSWTGGIINTSGDPNEKCENARKQYQYYSDLLDNSNNIIKALESSDYRSVSRYVRAMKGHNTDLHWVRENSFIITHIQVGNYTGGNVASNLITGLAGLLHSAVAFVVGVLCFLPYCCSATAYLGSPGFMVDAVKYFCDSLFKVVSSVIFPIGMLYSKYTTDSSNILRGDISRSLDSIERLAEEWEPKINSFEKEMEEIGFAASVPGFGSVD